MTKNELRLHILAKQVERYATHKPSCDRRTYVKKSNFDKRGTCTCGLAELVEQVRLLRPIGGVPTEDHRKDLEARCEP